MLLVPVLLLSGCFTDGTYTVGTAKGQVKPGTWLAPGGPGCTWSVDGPEPMSGSGSGRQQVTVPATATRFTTTGCGYWEESAGAPRTFTGTGSQVTPSFQLQAGALITTASHVGERNFIVHLVNDLGDDVDLLANEIGNSRSEVLTTRLTAGAYRLEIDADGDWSITITQPKSIGGRTVPTTFTGTGNAVLGPIFQSNRGVVFDAHHTGQRNFIVKLMKTNDIFGALIANEIGNASVSSIERLDGSYWISVQADGPWTISARY